MLKKIMMLMLMSVLLVSGAYAASIPSQKDGLIQDDAKLFTAGELKKLQAIADGEALTFHVLTINSLMGQEPASYAKQIYNSWGLTSKDVLLLIANEEGHVELNFKYTALQKEINNWGTPSGATESAAITRLLDKYFIPSAMEGNLAKATSTLIEGVHEIAKPLAIENSSKEEPAKQAAAEPTDQSTGQAPIEKPSEKQSDVPLPAVSSNEPIPAASKQPSAPREPISVVALVITAVVILAIGIAVILFIGWNRRKRLNQVNEDLSDLMVETNRVLEIASRFHGIAQGTTGQQINNSVDQLTELLIEASRLQTELTSLHLSLFRFNAIQRAALHYSEQVKKLRPLLEKESEQVAAIDEAERTAKAKIQELREETAALAGKRLGISSDTGYSLARIVERLERLEADLTKAEELELFDPVASLSVLEEAEQKHQQLDQDLMDVAVYVKHIQGVAARVTTCRNQIAQIIEFNSLHQIKVKPYEQLEQSGVELAKLEEYLNQGDMDEVRSAWIMVDSLIVNALAMTERQAMLRKKNREDLESINQRIIRYGIDQDRIKDQFVQTELRYAAHLWKREKDNLDHMDSELLEWKQKIPSIQLWSSDQQQEFDKARAHIDRLLQVMDKAESVLQGCTELFRALDERLQVSEHEMNELGRRYDNAQVMLGREGIYAEQNQSMNRSMSNCLQLFGEWKEKAIRFPLDLDQLERVLQQCGQQVSHFISEAEGLLRQKRELEHYMADIDRRMRQVSSAGRYSGIKQLQQNYNNYRPNVDHLMRSGMFTEAQRQLQFIAKDIERVEESIRAAQLAAERRRREAEERRYQSAQRILESSNRSSISSSGSSSSRSSSNRHSSGGSSFGGGNTSGGSSGGSSFKSGGDNHSSGGSSWKK